MSMYGCPTLPPLPRIVPVKIVELVSAGLDAVVWARSEDGRVFRSAGDGSLHEVVIHELSHRG